VLADGDRIAASTGPGLGVDLDQDAVECNLINRTH
jgi:hypothetical protein